MYPVKLEIEEDIKDGGMSVRITHQAFSINTRHDGFEFLKYRGYLDASGKFRAYGTPKSSIIAFEDAFSDEAFSAIFDRMPAMAEATEARKKALRLEAEEEMRKAQEKLGRAG